MIPESGEGDGILRQSWSTRYFRRLDTAPLLLPNLGPTRELRLWRGQTRYGVLGMLYLTLDGSKKPEVGWDGGRDGCPQGGRENSPPKRIRKMCRLALL
jgi:hypothetical protein